MFKKLKELRAKKNQLAEQRNTLITEIRTAVDASDEAEARSKSLQKEKLEARMEIIDEEIESVLALIEEERGGLPNGGEHRGNAEKTPQETRTLQLRAMAKTILRRELNEEERAAISVTNNGAIVPQEFIPQIEKLREGYPSLKQYCHVIPVNSNAGKMPVKKQSTRKLANLVEDTELTKAMLETQPLAYDIDDYGLLAPIDNSLLEDEGINFLDYVDEEFAECAVNTENDEIIAILEALLPKQAGDDIADMVKVINKLSPNARSRAVIVTNSEGRGYLDGLVDKQGRPLLKELSDGGTLIFKGRPVIEVDDVAMPIVEGKYDFYIGDTNSLIKFFDRKQYLVDQSKEAGYTKNQTVVRIIERFDVKGAIDKTDARVSKFGVKLTITPPAQV